MRYTFDAGFKADGGVGGTMIDPPDLYDVKHGTCSASLPLRLSADY